MNTHHPVLQRRLRLLFLTDSPITISGGSERFLRNLVIGLSGDRFEISVVQLCDEPPPAARLHEASIPSTVDISHLPCGAVYGSSGRRAYRALRRRVQSEGFHVIQSQHENADLFNASLPRGPLDATRISNRRDTGFLKSPRLRFASRFLNRRFDRIVAPSNAVLEAVAATEHGPRGRMSCIPNGVDSRRFRPVDEAARQATRARLGLTPDALLVGCVADLFAVKRHIDLVDAFARVHGAIPNAHLLLIGDGPERPAIEARIRECRIAERVRLLGSRNDVDALLPALDLFVLASDTEGLSNAILEAQACGLPVVATAVGGNPDLVDGERGMLVAPRDPEALAAAMRVLLGDAGMRARMGASARTGVVQGHSLEAMTRAYATLYRECADAR
ncbi:MAG TPA: glycosyltransferase [Rhodanobacteraceae bacterium]|nr:glycosyltransferase [Rhodanobacteraceae bacterium]